MSFEKELKARSGEKCELCGVAAELSSFGVEPTRNNNSDDFAYLCNTCTEQINNSEKTDSNHWRCLNDSMWSTVPAVQVLAWRMLSQLKSEGWPQNLLDMLYLDDDTLAWAKSGANVVDEDALKHIDSNGNILKQGDTVVLIKDLDVKGGGFTAKRGTSVRGISLDPENAEYIEGKVNGQQIVLLTQFVKKSS
jgi:protein PhnA